MEEFKRGEKVLVWDVDGGEKYERTFIAKIEGAKSPFVCVPPREYESHFFAGKKFDTHSWVHCEKLPEKKYRPLKGKELAQLYTETVEHSEFGKYIVCGVFFDRREIAYLKGKDGIQFARTGENLLNDGWTWNGKPIGVEV